MVYHTEAFNKIIINIPALINCRFRFRLGSVLGGRLSFGSDQDKINNTAFIITGNTIFVTLIKMVFPVVIPYGYFQWLYPILLLLYSFIKLCHTAEPYTQKK